MSEEDMQRKLDSFVDDRNSFNRKEENVKSPNGFFNDDALSDNDFDNDNIPKIREPRP